MGEEPLGSAMRLVAIGFVVIVVGFLLMMAGILLRGWQVEGEGSIAGIVLIGPIPIIWGAGPHSLELIIVGLLIVVVIMLAIMMMFPRRTAAAPP